MKTTKYILGLLACGLVMANLGVSAPTIVTGDSLNIGVVHDLRSTAAGSPNRNSIAAGAYNTNYANADAVIGGGYGNKLATNTEYSVIGAGQHNLVEATRSVLGGGWENRILITNGHPIGGGIDQNGTSYAVICGGLWNTLHGAAGVIGGGQANFIAPYGNFSVISGGLSNIIAYHSGYSTISGGTQNRIEKGAQWGAINGGERNVIEGPGDGTTNGAIAHHYGWIGGGYENYIEEEGLFGSIGGGAVNTVNGTFATIPGGSNNEAHGTNSFAAGLYAKANHDGAFVWGDHTHAAIASTAANQFIVRASGGIWLGTNSSVSIGAGRFIDTASGGNLTHGGQWSNQSDRNSKENFKPVDGRKILEKLAGMPVTAWNYKAEGKQIEHIGPVAQDFQATFQYGGDDKSISTSDASGVALAAIQGLYEMLREKDSQLKELRQELNAVKEQVQNNKQK